MSNRIPREFINELLARCDIVELIDTRVPLKKKGNNYSACCPFHNEKTPSFTVSQTKQFYHCFGCGANGNAISFLMDYDHLSFIEAVEQLANQAGMQVPREEGKASPSISPDLYDIMAQAANYYQQQLRQHPSAITYLKSRGLSGQVAKEFGIGYAPAGWDGLLKAIPQTQTLLKTGLIIKKNEGGFYDRFRERIMFPIRDRRGRVIAFGGRIIQQGEPKYLNSPETPIFHKGSELYGLFEACQATRKLTRLVVVEGYMDVVALAQHNIRNVVATLGTATTAEHITRLFRLTQEVIFCFDGDNAGQKAAWSALETALPLLEDGLQVRFLFLPQSEDPDSFVRKYGTEVFNQQLDNATLLPDFFLNHLAAQVNLNSLEGKAKLAKLASALLNKMPNGVFQQLLFERLGQLLRMDVRTLKNLTGTKTIHTAEVAPLEKTASLKRSPMRVAIALLIQHPNLIALLDETILTNFTLPGGDLLREIVGLLKTNTNLNAGMLLENWRERSEYNQLSQLATWDLKIPAAGVEQEFQGVIDALRKQNQENQIEHLLRKANLGQLSAEEKIELQNLIAALK